MTPLLAISGFSLALAAPLLITGADLTIDDVVQVARQGRQVTVAPAAYERLERAHRLLRAAAAQHMTVYGFNRGVGIDKDKVVLRQGPLDEADLQRSAAFNERMLAAHHASFGSEVPVEVVRATLLARLNGLVRGVAGVQPALVTMLVEFLNRGIHPVLLSAGSVGEADIAILPSIGLAMMGQRMVTYHGAHIPASEALAAEHLQPLRLLGKDGLAVIGSNAYSAGFGALVLADLEHLLQQMTLAYCMSLEALNGNIAPLLADAQHLRPFAFQQAVARRALHHLRGSDLFRISATRALQDPLSFRTATQVHGALEELLSSARDSLHLQLNSADDNPAVLVGASPQADSGSQVQALYLHDADVHGAIVPTANFEPITWVLKFEALAIALSHASRNATARMIVLANPTFTGLSRFLGADDDAIAFSPMQMAFLDLDNQIRALSNPTSVDFMPAAGGIEDHATNAPRVVARIQKISEHLRYIAGMELLHAAQAVDLRRRARPDQRFGEDVALLHARLRTVVPFLDRDRVLADDIARVHGFLRSR